VLNYYEILGVNRNADLAQIKASYKKLALKYHPDRNPGNKAAEEYFKEISAAYRVLSDADRRRRYDFLINYSYQTTTSKSPNRQQATQANRTKQSKTVYNRYGKFSWKNAPQYKKAFKYKVDKNYYKIQALSLLAMMILGSIVFSVNKYWEHTRKQELLAIQKQNEILLRKAQDMYENGQYRNAIELIIELDNNNPTESIFYTEKERMVSGLHHSAENLFKERDFEKAATRLEVVKDFEYPMKMSTWEMLADSYYNLEDYRKTVFALDKMLQRDKNNIRLAVKVAEIHQYKLNNKKRALDYYDEAKYLFKKFQNSVYGAAFELVVDPSNIPDYYNELFIERAKLNMEAGNLEEAMTDYNWSIFLRPKVASTYFKRGICKYQLNLTDRACKDWRRAVDRGHVESRSYLIKYCN